MNKKIFKTFNTNYSYNSNILNSSTKNKNNFKELHNNLPNFFKSKKKSFCMLNKIKPKILKYKGNNYRGDYIIKSPQGFFRFDETNKNKEINFIKNLRNYQTQTHKNSNSKKKKKIDINKLKKLSKPKSLHRIIKKEKNILSKLNYKKFIKASRYYLI